MISFKTQRLEIIRAEIAFERGLPVQDWETAQRFFIEGCRVQPRAGEEHSGSSEKNFRRNPTVNNWWVTTPYDADILPSDRVVNPLSGEICEILGGIRVHPSPLGGLEHKEFLLQKIEG